MRNIIIDYVFVPLDNEKKSIRQLVKFSIKINDLPINKEEFKEKLNIEKRNKQYGDIITTFNDILRQTLVEITFKLPKTINTKNRENHPTNNIFVQKIEDQLKKEIISKRYNYFNRIT